MVRWITWVGAVIALLASGPAMAVWQTQSGGGWATVTERATDAAVTARFNCTAAGISALSLKGYDGDRNLGPFSPERDRIFLVVEGKAGRQAFAVAIYYVDIDDEFASDFVLDPDLLAAWAAGNTMTLHGADGKRVATWTLAGTARGLQRMRNACGARVLSSGAQMAVPLSAVGAAPQDPAAANGANPDSVETAVRAELANVCNGERLEIGPDAITIADLTADGRPDAIVSFETIRCGGRRDFCGAQVCSLKIFVDTGAGLTTAVDMLSTAPTIVPGTPPRIEGHGHGGQPWALRWNGVTFDSPY